MPRPKKNTSVSGEKIIQRFVERKTIRSADFNPCSISKEMFLVITLYVSAVMLILISFSSIYSSASVLIKERSRIKNLSISESSAVVRSAGAVTYAVDKPKYGLNEDIKLSITNTSDKSIFLAPCQYFNKFEKKELNSWKVVILDTCEGSASTSVNEFEKIPLKEKQSISAVVLGAGVWRGVSDVYLDCQKADIVACKSKKVVYSNEFKIETQKIEAPEIL